VAEILEPEMIVDGPLQLKGNVATQDSVSPLVRKQQPGVLSQQVAGMITETCMGIQAHPSGVSHRSSRRGLGQACLRRLALLQKELVELQQREHEGSDQSLEPNQILIRFLSTSHLDHRHQFLMVVVITASGNAQHTMGSVAIMQYGTVVQPTDPAPIIVSGIVLHPEAFSLGQKQQTIIEVVMTQRQITIYRLDQRLHA
jgi:hypothetical protein